MNEEIVSGLRNAVERGITIESAVRSFINAGYDEREVREASQRLMQGAGMIANTMISPPIQNEKVPIKKPNANNIQSPQKSYLMDSQKNVAPAFLQQTKQVAKQNGAPSTMLSKLPAKSLPEPIQPEQYLLAKKPDNTPSPLANYVPDSLPKLSPANVPASSNKKIIILIIITIILIAIAILSIVLKEQIIESIDKIFS